MKLSDVENIFQRAIRLRERSNEKSGLGTNWSYTFEDNETHEYVLNGIKSFDEIQDDIEMDTGIRQHDVLFRVVIRLTPHPKG